ncbi:MAG: sulfotransferase [Gammaproteobacteria bacterium]|nr:sulfotransferase [Gammaproteobacteria bacterium]MDE2345480.1 sulfotransferase [Gammaproteobacteria bacterium]
MLISQAIAFQKQGKFSDAEQLLRQALQLNPRHAAAIHYLGLTSHQQGRHDDAETLLRKALELEPNNPVFLGNFAQFLVVTEHPLQAVPIYERWLTLEPKNALIWYQLGTVLQGLEGLDPAAECYRCALSINPDLTQALITLADCQKAAYLRQEAEASYRLALKKLPRDADLHCKLAALLIEMQRIEEALELLDAAAGFAPSHPGIFCQRGIALSVAGRFDAAEQALRHAIVLAPDYFNAYAHLVNIRKLNLDDPVYQRLQNAASMPDNDQDAGMRVNVQYSLARILQDNREYQRAFDCFTSCKTARRKLIPYSHAAQAASYTAIRNLFDADYIGRMRKSGNHTNAPIFIVGMPRSGTTLLEQSLARHPLVRSGGEMVLLHAALRRRFKDRYRSELADSLRDMGEAGYRELAGSIASSLQPMLGSARHMTDKMPSNFALAGLLHVLFPNAAIIHCRRNPLDTCVSCYTTLFQSAHGFADDLQDLGKYYRLYLEMMAHWRHLLPETRFYELQYEELVTEPEAQIRRLLEFLHLPWHPECMNFGSTGPIHTASVAQVRQPLYRTSIDRWQPYKHRLGRLLEALGDTSGWADTI